MPALSDLSGQVFSRLTVVKLDPVRHGIYRHWICRCECGNTTSVRTASLRNGKKRSCGCLMLEAAATLARRCLLKHGKTETTEYRIWCGIKYRCYVHSCPAYKNYGGRGVTVADIWLNDFAAFVAYVGARPSMRHTLDRIDTNGNYEPGNVRWATWEQQQNNRRNNHLITKDGVTHTLAEWCKLLGIHRSLVDGRMRQGWPEHKLLYPSTRIRRVSQDNKI